MKICMLLKRDFERFKKDSRVLREAYALKESGNDVTIILYGREDNDHFYNNLHIICMGIRDIHLFSKYNIYNSDVSQAKRNILQKVVKKFASIFYEMKYQRCLYRKALSVDAGIYHCHDFETLSAGCKLKDKSHIKLVYDSHELWTESIGYTGFIKRLYKNLILIRRERRYIKIADTCITVSESISQYLSSRYGIKKPYVLRNLSMKVSQGIFKDCLREELKIGKDKKIVLYQGSLSKGRGLMNMIKAWRHVNKFVVLVIMGYGCMYGDIKSIIQQEELSERVYIKDAVSPEVLLDYTSSADAGICSTENICVSHYLSSPNKMWEYIAAGIPVLASDFPEMGRFLCREELGLSFNPDSPEDIASKVNYLLDDKNAAIYKKLKSNCLEKSKSIYNWDNEKKLLLHIYMNLTAQGC